MEASKSRSSAVFTPVKTGFWDSTSWESSYKEGREGERQGGREGEGREGGRE